MSEFVIDIKIDAAKARAGAEQAKGALDQVRGKARETQKATVDLDDQMRGFGKSVQQSLNLIKGFSLLGAVSQARGMIEGYIGLVNDLADAVGFVKVNWEEVAQAQQESLNAFQRNLATIARGKGIGQEYAGMTDEQKAAAVAFDIASPEEQERLGTEQRINEQMAISARLGEVLKESEAERTAEAERQRQAQAKITAELERQAKIRAEFDSLFATGGAGGDSKQTDEYAPGSVKYFERLDKESAARVQEETRAEAAAAEEKADLAREVADENARLANEAAVMNAAMLDDLRQQEIAREQKKADEIEGINQQLYANVAATVGDMIHGSEKEQSAAIKRMLAEIAKFAVARAAMELGASASGAGAIGSAVTGLLGFAEGGDFTVGGAGGTDSKRVAFMATPGERVSIRKPGQDAATSAAPVNLKVVNRFDPSDMVGVLESGAGERVMLNVIRRHATTIGRMLR